MKYRNLYKAFEYGRLELSNDTINLNSNMWSGHLNFEGVEIKDIIKGKYTDNQFSCHLLKIEPDKELDFHTNIEQLEAHEVISGHGYAINDGKIIDYYPGVISIFKKKEKHKIIAGKKGLYIFMKFIPALQ